MNRYPFRDTIMVKFVRSTVFAMALNLPGFGFSQTADPLPSWNAGPTKDSIIEFVKTVTTKDSPDYVTPAERIATFDNDGCLWSDSESTPRTQHATIRFGYQSRGVRFDSRHPTRSETRTFDSRS